MLESLTTGSGILDSIAAMIIVSCALWFGGKSVIAARNFLSISKELIEDYQTGSKNRLEIAESKARYRDLYTSRALFISIRSVFFCLISAIFICAIMILSHLTYISPIWHIASYFLTAQFVVNVIIFNMINIKSEKIFSKWMNQLEEKNG